MISESKRQPCAKNKLIKSYVGYYRSYQSMTLRICPSMLMKSSNTYWLFVAEFKLSALGYFIWTNLAEASSEQSAARTMSKSRPTLEE